MNIILDTCVFLWSMQTPDTLSSHAKEIIVHADNVYLSAISVWEIGFKNTLGKLPLARPLAPLLQELSQKGLIIPLAFSAQDAATQIQLPLLHKDPFDRMLICQAMTHDLTIVTPDSVIQKYDVKTIW